MAQTISDGDLGEGFRSHFDILPAIDETARNQVYAVRHEVYCEDLGYEPARANHRETDEYDRHSVHCLLRTTDDTHTLVGCTRLILARPEDPDYPFPFEVACRDNLDRHTIDSRKLPRDHIGEVSRLAVRRMYRRRRGEKHTDSALKKRDFGTPLHPRFPFIPVSLYLGAMALADRYGIEKVFVLTEARLATHLAHLGFDIQQIGPAVEMRGARVPSVVDIPASIVGVRSLIRSIWDTVREEIDASYQAARNRMS